MREDVRRKQKYREAIESNKGWKQQRLRQVQLQVRDKKKELYTMLDNQVQTQTAGVS